METIEARLLANRIVDDGDCWLWTKSCQTNGYGQTFYQGRNTRVHRLAAHLWLGFDLQSDLCVLHSCDVRLCFNPAHLFLGTRGDNTQDMMNKGRGKTHPRREMPPEFVALVRAGASERKIAAVFGVSRATVRKHKHRL